MDPRCVTCLPVNDLVLLEMAVMNNVEENCDC
jgi:hypothetical protein